MLVFLFCFVASYGAIAQPGASLVVEYKFLVDSTYTMGEMSAFLGVISSDTSNEKSILNLHGAHGSDEAFYSIFGDGWAYKGLHGVFSPFNEKSESPPKIFRDSVFVAYLTNERLSPRISGYSLVGYLYEKVGIRVKAK